MYYLHERVELYTHPYYEVFRIPCSESRIPNSEIMSRSNPTQNPNPKISHAQLHLPTTQNPNSPNVWFKYSIKLDRWPKIQNVTPSHSLLGQLYGPKRDIVTTSHSLLGQLHGPKRDQKLFKNSNKVKKLFKNSKNRKCDDVTFLIGSTLWPKIQNVTPSHSLLGQLYGLEYTLQTAWLRQKIAFFQMAWREAAIGLIYSGRYAC